MKSLSKRAFRDRLAVAAAVIVAIVIAAACAADSSSPVDSDAGNGALDADGDSPVGHLGDGSLGVVEVPAGSAIQIRSLNSITGDVAPLGLTNQGGIELAVADYGTIRGFEVSLGTRLDSLCTPDGGQAAAQSIVADEAVVGVIGTSCSAAATAAAPLLTRAGIAMIAPSNTSPSLTSDLAGNEGDNHSVGYYRTSHNALLEGEAVALFLRRELDVATAAAIHDGDAYTQGLAEAFRAAFERSGGTVTAFVGINKEDSDMVPVLTEVAAGRPEALFFPIFQPAGDHLADQARRVDGIEDAAMLSSAGLLVDGFMRLAQSERMYFSGPDLDYGTNANQSTGRSADEVLRAYQDTYGEPPSAQYWAHAYDATALLLDAVAAASYVTREGSLVIDRAGIRQHLDSVSRYRGLIGTLSCDKFGDCGSRRVTVIHHLDPENVEAGRNNVVFEYSR